MNWKILKLENNIERPKMTKRKRIIIVIIFVVAFLFLCLSDDMQQRRFALLEKGYQLMDAGEYSKAIVIFDEYLAVDSDLYWKLIDKINSYEYSCQGVNEAIGVCRDNMEKLDLK